MSSTRIHDMLERAAGAAKHGGPILVYTGADAVAERARLVERSDGEQIEQSAAYRRLSGPVEHSHARGRVLSVR